MKFKFLTDPLFVFCLAAYAVNRFVVKVYFPNTFSICYFNDLICIPFWLPFMLLFMRVLRLRGDGPPRSYEILVPLIMWSWYFEIYLPGTDKFRGVSFADPTDILFYAIGALVSTLFWQFWYRSRETVVAAEAE